MLVLLFASIVAGKDGDDDHDGSCHEVLVMTLMRMMLVALVLLLPVAARADADDGREYCSDDEIEGGCEDVGGKRDVRGFDEG